MRCNYFSARRARRGYMKVNFVSFFFFSNGHHIFFSTRYIEIQRTRKYLILFKKIKFNFLYHQNIAFLKLFTFYPIHFLILWKVSETPGIFLNFFNKYKTEIQSKIFAEGEKISNFEKFLESEFLEKFLDRLPVNLYSPDTKLKN